jgi:hypothetical protein
VAAAIPVAAHDPITTKLTWTRDISRIVYKRCAGCHREDGKAPMSLLTYEDARPWAKAIKEEVLERRMPPGGAVKGFGDFVDDGALSQEELHVMADWVEGGAPEGDPIYLPSRPAPPDPEPYTPVRLLPRKLETAQTIRAIQPHGLPKGSSIRFLAELPGGRIQPLLWIYNYRPEYERLYTYREPIRLPAGTRIVRSPDTSGDLLVSVAAGRER